MNASICLDSTLYSKVGNNFTKCCCSSQCSQSWFFFPSLNPKSQPKCQLSWLYLHCVFQSSLECPPEAKLKLFSKCSIDFWMITVMSQTKISAIKLNLLAERWWGTNEIPFDCKWSYQATASLPVQNQIIDKTQYRWTYLSLWWKRVGVHVSLVRDYRDWWEV